MSRRRLELPTLSIAWFVSTVLMLPGGCTERSLDSRENPEAGTRAVHEDVSPPLKEVAPATPPGHPQREVPIGRLPPADARGGTPSSEQGSAERDEDGRTRTP